MATNYGLVIRHSSWWRGNQHRWSCVYPYVSTGSPVGLSEAGILGAVQAHADIVWMGPDNDQGNLYEAEFYNLDAGGSALLTVAYGVQEDYGSGLECGAAWENQTVLKQSTAEVALLLEWDGGLSRTGKPVTFRKFIHGVQVSNAADGGNDITSTTEAAITTRMTTIQNHFVDDNLALGNTRRLAGTNNGPSVRYYNHQMPRGRRRKS
uniref:Uncharacterized protein n=1 Tax=uncultured prokaryote TaxID=198431 RepID=A0A0H5Q5M5_9ZZZZ|nr:hypothetical protein [uncultured prokaryote]